MVVLAILILMVKIPLKIIVYIFTHKILLVALVGVVGLIIFSRACASKPEASRVEVPQYQKVAPSEADAPWVIQTASRIYYVREYVEETEAVKMIKYYIYDGKKWVFCDFPLPLDRSIYKNITILRR